MSATDVVARTRADLAGAARSRLYLEALIWSSSNRAVAVGRKTFTSDLRPPTFVLSRACESS